MNNELLIKNIDHRLLFSMLFVSILSAVFIYNIFQLIYKCLKRKKLKNTIKLILEGHEKLSVGKEDIIIEGEVLDNNMIANQIQKNKDKLKKQISDQKTKQVKKNAKKKRENSVKDFNMNSAENVLSKNKTKRKRKPLSIEELFDNLYQKEEVFDAAIDLYYDIKLPNITDPTVKLKIESLKRSKHKKFEQQNLFRQNLRLSIDNENINLFD